jgi:hypothetical protein
MTISRDTTLPINTCFVEAIKEGDLKNILYVASAFSDAHLGEKLKSTMAMFAAWRAEVKQDLPKITFLTTHALHRHNYFNISKTLTDKELRQVLNGVGNNFSDDEIKECNKHTLEKLAKELAESFYKPARKLEKAYIAHIKNIFRATFSSDVQDDYILWEQTVYIPYSDTAKHNPKMPRAQYHDYHKTLSDIVHSSDNENPIIQKASEEKSEKSDNQMFIEKARQRFSMIFKKELKGFALKKKDLIKQQNERLRIANIKLALLTEDQFEMVTEVCGKNYLLEELAGFPRLSQKFKTKITSYTNLRQGSDYGTRFRTFYSYDYQVFSGLVYTDKIPKHFECVQDILPVETQTELNKRSFVLPLNEIAKLYKEPVEILSVITLAQPESNAPTSFQQITPNSDAEKGYKNQYIKWFMLRQRDKTEILLSSNKQIAQYGFIDKSKTHSRYTHSDNLYLKFELEQINFNTFADAKKFINDICHTITDRKRIGLVHEVYLKTNPEFNWLCHRLPKNLDGTIGETLNLLKELFIAAAEKPIHTIDISIVEIVDFDHSIKLKLSRNRLEDAFLNFSVKVKKLILKRVFTYFTFDDLKFVLKLLPVTLDEVVLSNNLLNKFSSNELVELFRSVKLNTEIIISSNNLAEFQVDELGAIFQAFSAKKKLDLRNNGFEELPALTLANIFSHIPPSITILYLDFNERQFSQEELKTIARSVPITVITISGSNTESLIKLRTPSVESNIVISSSQKLKLVNTIIDQMVIYLDFSLYSVAKKQFNSSFWDRLWHGKHSMHTILIAKIELNNCHNDIKAAIQLLIDLLSRHKSLNAGLRDDSFDTFFISLLLEDGSIFSQLDKTTEFTKFKVTPYEANLQCSIKLFSPEDRKVKKDIAIKKLSALADVVDSITCSV